MLSIRLLGTPHIAYADHSVAISRRKSRALLYYLAAHPTPLTRDHLLTFFWPDADRQAAQQNLRTTLYGLRKIFGDLLCVNDDTLALAVTSEVDTRTFAAQLALPSIELGHFNEISIQCLPNKIIRRCVLLAARSAYTPIVRLKARTYWILYSLIAP